MAKNTDLLVFPEVFLKGSFTVYSSIELLLHDYMMIFHNKKIKLLEKYLQTTTRYSLGVDLLLFWIWSTKCANCSIYHEQCGRIPGNT